MLGTKETGKCCLLATLVNTASELKYITGLTSSICVGLHFVSDPPVHTEDTLAFVHTVMHIYKKFEKKARNPAFEGSIVKK